MENAADFQDAAFCMTAVSYTHLDVYKRQELRTLVFEKIEQFAFVE